jgi:pimeloyl-ACP methyl ester carboxylesterase
MRKSALLIIVLLAGRVSIAAAQQTLQDLTFVATSDGTVQNYVLLLPAKFDSSAQHDVLIALHGHGSDRWQYIKAARDETRAASDSAAKYQMIYVSPEYRGTMSWMGPKAEGDLTQIITILKKEYRIGRIILTGGSMGGTSALTYAALHPDLIDGVASMNGTANQLEYTGFQEAISASFGGTKDQIPEEYKLRSAEYWPERLTMPIAITASGQDATIPPASVLRLANILQNLHRKVLLIYEKSEGHKTSYADAITALDFAIEGASYAR